MHVIYENIHKRVFCCGGGFNLYSPWGGAEPVRQGSPTQPFGGLGSGALGGHAAGVGPIGGAVAPPGAGLGLDDVDEGNWWSVPVPQLSSPEGKGLGRPRPVGSGAGGGQAFRSW